MKAMRQGVVASLEAEKKKRAAKGTDATGDRSRRAEAAQDRAGLAGAVDLTRVRVNAFGPEFTTGTACARARHPAARYQAEPSIR